MPRPGDRELVLAFATYMVYGGYERVRRKYRYLVFWNRSNKLCKMLERYGIMHECRQYSYRKKDRKRTYKRYKIIVRDEEAIEKAKELLKNEKKLKWYMQRMTELVREVMTALKTSKNLKRIMNLLGTNTFKKLVGLKPFRLKVYRVFRNLRIVRELKPNWRFYRLVKYVAGYYGVEALYRLMDRYRWAVINI